MPSGNTRTETDDDSEQVNRRRFLEATGGAAAATLVAGYSGEPAAAAEADGPAEVTAQQQGQTLNIILTGTITTFDPVAATDTASGTVIQNVFDALMNYPNGEAEVEPLLAANFERSDDLTTYTFDLKEAQFHNGDAVTAQDFIYAFERLAASPNSRRASFILDSLGVVHETTENEDGEEVYQSGTLGLEAVDDSTLRVQLEEPFHASLEMLAYSAFSAVPEGLVGDIEGYDGEIPYQQFATSNPVGAGPYQFEEWVQGTSADVTAFGNYHGGAPANAGVHWDVIEDDTAAYNHGMNENADIFVIPTAQYEPGKVSVDQTDDLGREIGTYGPLRNDRTANYLSVPIIDTFYIGFNMAEVPKPVRQAFAYATNQQLLVNEVFKQRGVPAYHFTPKNIYPGAAQAYDQHAQNNYPYGYNESQLEQARQVMEQAGYGANNRFQVQWTQYQSDTWSQIAQILRDQLASAYIDMQIEQAPFATLTQRGRNGNLEVYTLGWIADWPAPDNFLALLDPPRTDTSQQAPISYINWTSENGDAAGQAEEAYNTIQDNPQPSDQARQAREEAYVQVEEANWEDVGFLNIFHELGERFTYQWLDIPKYGGMGTSRQKYNEAAISSRE